MQCVCAVVRVGGGVAAGCNTRVWAGKGQPGVCGVCVRWGWGRGSRVWYPGCCSNQKDLEPHLQCACVDGRRCTHAYITDLNLLGVSLALYLFRGSGCLCQVPQFHAACNRAAHDVAFCASTALPGACTELQVSC